MSSLNNCNTLRVCPKPDSLKLAIVKSRDYYHQLNNCNDFINNQRVRLKPDPFKLAFVKPIYNHGIISLTRILICLLRYVLLLYVYNTVSTLSNPVLMVCFLLFHNNPLFPVAGSADSKLTASSRISVVRTNDQPLGMRTTRGRNTFIEKSRAD